MVARGIVRHCPRCGSGHLFSSWFRMKPRCPGCGMKFEREEGFWLGGYVINIALGEASILVLLAVLIGMEANQAPINAVLFVGIGAFLAVTGPLIAFPYSRTIWSAIDQIMRPLAPEEVADAQGAVATAAMAGHAEGSVWPTPPDLAER
jgi:uncharacterized protein (DUF983 family)